MTVPPRPAEELAPRWQFSISSLLWLMVTVGMVLAYVQNRRPEAISILSVTLVLAVGAGAAFGTILGRPGDGIYWSLLGTLLATLSALNFPELDAPLVAVWSWVGALSGGMAGAIRPGLLLRKCCVCGVLGLVMMTGGYSIGLVPEPAVDVPFAAVVGVLLAILSDLVHWLHTRYGTSRDMWACGLIFAVIGGSLAAKLLANGR